MKCNKFEDKSVRLWDSHIFNQLTKILKAESSFHILKRYLNDGFRSKCSVCRYLDYQPYIVNLIFDLIHFTEWLLNF